MGTLLCIFSPLGWLLLICLQHTSISYTCFSLGPSLGPPQLLYVLYLFFLLTHRDSWEVPQSRCLCFLAACFYPNPIHSDFGAGHCTETIMLKVTRDISVNKSRAFVSLTLLYRSASWVYIPLPILALLSFLNIHGPVSLLLLSLWLNGVISDCRFYGFLLVFLKVLHMYICLVYIIQNFNGSSIW